MRLAILLATLALAAGVASAQAPRITNEASGLACYYVQHLMDAHSALGYYQMDRVQELINAERCFVMQRGWRVMRIQDESFIGGVEATILEVRLEVSQREVRIAWTLEGNISGE